MFVFEPCCPAHIALHTVLFVLVILSKWMNEWMSKTNEELAVDCSRLADQRRRTTGRSPIVERRVDGKTARSADDAERKRLYLSYKNRMGSSCKRISVGEDCLVLGLLLSVCVFSLQSVLFLRFLCCVHSVGCLLRFCCLCKWLTGKTPKWPTTH